MKTLIWYDGTHCFNKITVQALSPINMLCKPIRSSESCLKGKKGFEFMSPTAALIELSEHRRFFRGGNLNHLQGPVLHPTH